MSRKPQECKPDYGDKDYGNHGKSKDCPTDDKCDAHCAALISADADINVFKHSVEVCAEVLDGNSLLDVDVEIA